MVCASSTSRRLLVLFSTAWQRPTGCRADTAGLETGSRRGCCWWWLFSCCVALLFMLWVCILSVFEQFGTKAISRSFLHNRDPARRGQ